MSDDFEPVVRPVPSPDAPAPSDPPPADPAPEPAAGRWRTWVPVGVVALAIAIVAGGRMLMRDDGPGPIRQDEGVRRTGRTVAVEIAPLPAGLVQEGTFRCAELRVGSRATAQVEGGSINNVSGKSLALGFSLTVRSGSSSETVERRFEMLANQKVPSFLMASKSVPPGVSACSLRIFVDPAGPEAIARVASAARAAGCQPPQSLPIEGTKHVAPPKTVEYDTVPPTSGDHYASKDPAAPGRTGVHREPIRNEVQVHNLEHGHVGVQYRGVSAAVREALEGVAGGASAPWVFVAPYPDMQSALALSAWGVLLTCDAAPAPDTVASLARSFVEVYRNRAPESIPGTPR